MILSIYGSAEGVGTVNTLFLLAELRDSGVISEEAFSSYVERLILLNYMLV